MVFQKGLKTNINKKNKLVRKLKKVSKLKKKNLERKNVKIGTFNVYEWHNVQDILNFKEQCRYINSLDCDILGLQEVIIKDNTVFSLRNLSKIFNKYYIFDCTFDVYWHQDDAHGHSSYLDRRGVGDCCRHPAHCGFGLDHLGAKVQTIARGRERAGEDHPHPERFLQSIIEDSVRQY